MTAPKFLYQIIKEFKDQTNKRISNLATTIKRSQRTFNVLKHQEKTSRYGEQFGCVTRQTGSFLDYNCTTVHDTKDGDCPLTTAPNNELVPGTTVHEAGRVWKQLTRMSIGRRTAVSRHRDGCRRRSTSSDDTARRRTSDFNPDSCRQATTWRPKHGRRTAWHGWQRRRT